MAKDTDDPLTGPGPGLGRQSRWLAELFGR